MPRQRQSSAVIGESCTGADVMRLMELFPNKAPAFNAEARAALVPVASFSTNDASVVAAAPIPQRPSSSSVLSVQEHHGALTQIAQRLFAAFQAKLRQQSSSAGYRVDSAASGDMQLTQTLAQEAQRIAQAVKTGGVHFATSPNEDAAWRRSGTASSAVERPSVLQDAEEDVQAMVHGFLLAGRPPTDTTAPVSRRAGETTTPATLQQRNGRRGLGSSNVELPPILRATSSAAGGRLPVAGTGASTSRRRTVGDEVTADVVVAEPALTARAPEVNQQGVDIRDVIVVPKTLVPSLPTVGGGVAPSSRRGSQAARRRSTAGEANAAPHRTSTMVEAVSSAEAAPPLSVPPSVSDAAAEGGAMAHAAMPIVIPSDSTAAEALQRLTTPTNETASRAMAARVAHIRDLLQSILMPPDPSANKDRRSAVGGGVQPKSTPPTALQPTTGSHSSPTKGTQPLASPRGVTSVSGSSELAVEERHLEALHKQRRLLEGLLDRAAATIRMASSVQPITRGGDDKRSPAAGSATAKQSKKHRHDAHVATTTPASGVSPSEGTQKTNATPSANSSVPTTLPAISGGKQQSSTHTHALGATAGSAATVLPPATTTTSLPSSNSAPSGAGATPSNTALSSVAGTTSSPSMGATGSPSAKTFASPKVLGSGLAGAGPAFATPSGNTSLSRGTSAAVDSNAPNQGSGPHQTNPTADAAAAAAAAKRSALRSAATAKGTVPYDWRQAKYHSPSSSSIEAMDLVERIDAALHRSPNTYAGAGGEAADAASATGTAGLAPLVIDHDVNHAATAAVAPPTVQPKAKNSNVIAVKKGGKKQASAEGGGGGTGSTANTPKGSGGKYPHGLAVTGKGNAANHSGKRGSLSAGPASRPSSRSASFTPHETSLPTLIVTKDYGAALSRAAARDADDLEFGSIPPRPGSGRSASFPERRVGAAVGNRSPRAKRLDSMLKEHRLKQMALSENIEFSPNISATSSSDEEPDAVDERSMGRKKAVHLPEERKVAKAADKLAAAIRQMKERAEAAAEYRRNQVDDAMEAGFVSSREAAEEEATDADLLQELAKDVAKRDRIREKLNLVTDELERVHTDCAILRSGEGDETRESVVQRWVAAPMAFSSSEEDDEDDPAVASAKALRRVKREAGLEEDVEKEKEKEEANGLAFLQQLADAQIMKDFTDLQTATIGVQADIAAPPNRLGDNVDMRDPTSVPNRLIAAMFRNEQNLFRALDNLTIAVANLSEFFRALEVDLTCKSCLTTLSQPRSLLGCGHCFCAECVNGMYIGLEAIQCAECAHVSHVGFAPNTSVETIVSQWHSRALGREESILDELESLREGIRNAEEDVVSVYGSLNSANNARNARTFGRSRMSMIGKLSHGDQFDITNIRDVIIHARVLVDS